MIECRASEMRSLLRRSLATVLMALLAVVCLSPSAFAVRTTYNVDGTFNVPAGVDTITVEAWGGGGGGGGGAGKSTGTGGGGGGAYAKSTINGASGSYSVVIGQGGASDTAGTASTFDGTVVVAPGGSAGSATGAGGAGGSGGTGTITYSGGTGAAGVDNPNGYGGGGGSGAGTASNGTTATGQPGATAPAGGGDGGPGATAAGGAGGNGLVPGGGGGGSMRTGGPVVGGAGANGRIYVYYGPTVTINQGGGQADPTPTSPVVFDVVFSEPVTGFAAGDVFLSGTATGKSVSNVSGAGTNYTVEVSATGGGTIIATIPAGGAVEGFNIANFASTSTDNEVTYVTAAPPTVTINQKGGQIDPTNGVIDTMDFTVVFSEDMNGFDHNDIVISGDAVVNALTAGDVTGGPATFNVRVTGLSSGTVVADIPAAVATSQSSGLDNEASTSSDNLINFDNQSPDVTIDQAGAQADPTAGTPILFDVVFNEDVSGFAAGDISLSGPAATVTSVTGGPATYSVEVTPTENGIITASVPAGGATDVAGNTNNGSTSTDPDVEFTGASCTDSTPSTITIPASQTVSGAAVDLESLFSTTGNVTLFTYTIEAATVDTPWNSSAYGASGSEPVTLYVEGTDPDCGGSTVFDTNTINVDNSSINFMMHNSDTTSSSKWPIAESGESADGWGIVDAKYGQFTCETCHTKSTTNIKRIRENLPTVADGVPESPTTDFPGNAITFTSTVEGSSDLGDDSDAHSTSNRVCEVCHSKNKFHNYDTANNALNGGDNNHANQTDCLVCHSHKVGFYTPGCTSCHGEPPSSAANLVYSPSATGATNPESAGGHPQHGAFQGMSCETCHTGNTMPTVSTTIQMGFVADSTTVARFNSAVGGGTISVPNDGLLSNGYTFASSDGGTTVNKVADYNLNCTVYCHGNWVGSAGTNTTPSWVGGSSQASCGTCHGADGTTPPTAGSHTAHAATAGNVKLSCNKCHPSYTDTQHLDGEVVWQLATGDGRIGTSATYSGSASGTTGAAAPSGAYGNCANVYCHGTDTPTWGGATLGCNGCHSANSSLPATHSTHYDSAAVVTGNTTDNNSTTTNYVFECGNCHEATKTAHAFGTVSGSQSAEVKFTDSSVYTAGALLGNEGVFNYTDGTCGFNACHNNGKETAGAPNEVAQWGSTLPANCTGCHNNGFSSGSPLTSGAHAAHISSGTVIDILCCSDCHDATVDQASDVTITDKTKHLNGVREVYPAAEHDSDADPSNNYNDATQECTNIYCHSNGQASPSYQTIAWTDTALCNTCHDNAGTTSNLTGSHLVHIGTDPSDTNKQFGYTCNVCHVQTASSNSAISSTSLHINKTRDVSVSASYGGDQGLATNYNSVLMTCATTNCHGTSSFSWTAGATLGDCSACHGMSDPGQTSYDTNGDTADSDFQVGAHDAHINITNGYAAPVTCDQCHNLTYSEILGQTSYVAKVNAVGHNDSALPAEVTYGSIATAAGATTTYNTITGVCANYCHGNTLADGFSPQPLWNDNSYLNGTFNANGDCNRCHGAPPLITGHSGSETLADCGQCHTQTMTDGVGNAFADASKHINGILEVDATCGTCHGQLPPNTGSHPKHGIHLEQDLGYNSGNLDGGFTDWTVANYPTCAVCHDLTNQDYHLDPSSNILGVNKPDEAFAPDYPVAGPGYPVYNTTTQTCTNARCHFQSSPDWQP